MTKHYVGEIGTELIFDVGILIGSVTAQQIKYLKPDGVTEGTFSASLYSSYSILAGGLIGTYFVKYTIASGDWGTSGLWKMQPVIGTSGGTWFGETVDLNIYD